MPKKSCLWCDHMRREGLDDTLMFKERRNAVLRIPVAEINNYPLEVKLRGRFTFNTGNCRCVKGIIHYHDSYKLKRYRMDSHYHNNGMVDWDIWGGRCPEFAGEIFNEETGEWEEVIGNVD